MKPAINSNFIEDLYVTAERISSNGKPSSFSMLKELEVKLKSAKSESIRKSKERYEYYRGQCKHSPFFEDITLFEPMGFENRETLFSRTLAWLLDSSKQHKLNSNLTQRLFELASKKYAQKHGKPLTEISKHYSVIPEWQVTPKCRIDIGIRSPNRDWVIIVEVKIDAVERPKQLDDYLSAVKGRGFRKIIPILLTKAEFEKKSDSKDKWIHVHYQDLAGVLLQVLDIQHEQGNEPHPIARYFAAGVLRDICQLGTGSNPDKLLREANCFDFEKFTEDYFNV